jgi:hypothetical protein
MWLLCGYYEETVETYDSVKNICFNFNIYNCNEICKEMSFMCCSHFRNFLCFYHFFNDYHIHELN